MPASLHHQHDHHQARQQHRKQQLRSSLRPASPEARSVSGPEINRESFLIADESDVLVRIGEPDINLSLWRRPSQPAIAEEVSRLAADALPDVRCSTSLARFEIELSQLLASQGLDPIEFKHWIADMHLLAERYAGIHPLKQLNVRLITTDEVSCPRFHIDQTNLRLLCTYQGPGTEWLTNAQADRAAQASGAPNDEIVRFGEPQRFEPFWVGIMKGGAYPGNAGRGLVHRSPPVGGSSGSGRNETRVLFCLDG